MFLAAIHLFEEIPLRNAGIVLGSILILAHGIALWKPKQVEDFLVKAHRNQRLGQILILLATLWFFALIAPSKMSPFSMSLAEFDAMRGILQLVVPVLGLLVAFTMKEFLFVRALGTLGLLVTYPFLEAAFLKDPTWRLLIPIWSYAVIILSLFWVGMPYTFRDQVAWLIKKPMRMKILSWAGLLYGILLLSLSFTNI